MNIIIACKTRIISSLTVDGVRQSSPHTGIWICVLLFEQYSILNIIIDANGLSQI